MKRLTEYVDDDVIIPNQREKIGYKPCMKKLAAYEDTGYDPNDITNLRMKYDILLCKYKMSKANSETSNNNAKKEKDQVDKLEALLKLALLDLEEVSMCDNCIHSYNGDCDPSEEVSSCSWEWRYNDLLSEYKKEKNDKKGD